MTKPTLVHVTTTDMSLDWLLGSQLESFAAAGYDVIGVSAAGDHVEAIEARGIRHVALESATREMDLWSDLRALSELRRLLIGLRADIVHTHNPKPGVYGRLAAALAGVPTVVNTVHGLYAQPGDPLARRLAVYGAEWFASRFSDAELVQNAEDLPMLESIGVPAAKLYHLGNGIDLNRFGPSPSDDERRLEARKALGLQETDVLVGAVGRLVAEKGYPELLEAFEWVGVGQPGVRLAVVGPSDSAKPDALAPSLLAGAERAGVKFLGERHDMVDLYRAMDLYVLASHREGFPRSAMEAAAMGLPIVATDIRGCRQVVEAGRTGLLTPVGNVASLAAAIGDLASDVQRRRSMGAAARTKAECDFDQARVIDITLGVYERVLGGGS